MMAWLLALFGCGRQQAQTDSGATTKQTDSVNVASQNNTNFDSPEHAVETLLAAYQARDIDRMVAAKDFAIDAKIFWQNLGLPVTDKQMKDSVVAFESNFRKQMKEDGIPDYRGVTHAFVGREQLPDGLVVLTVDCRWPDGHTRRMKLPAFKNGTIWKVVRSPAYNQL